MNQPLTETVLREFFKRHLYRDMTAPEVANHLGTSWTAERVVAHAKKLGVGAPVPNLRLSAVHTPVADFSVARHVQKTNLDQ